MEKVVRIVLTQKIAHYRKEETVDNKMTYPLPPFSTVIGAIHKACGYTKYQPMCVSVQGKYGGMVKKVYYDSCFLNNLQNDRGTLVKMKNANMISNAFEVVAESKKKRGNDFRKGTTIQVFNEKLIQEYRDLRDKADEIEKNKKELLLPYLQRIKEKKSVLKQEKERNVNDDIVLQEINEREHQLVQLEKLAKEKFEEYKFNSYTVPISKFRSLTKGPKYYELLTDVKLIIHIKATNDVMNNIVKNAGNIVALGRGEDFVDVSECKIVNAYEMNEIGFEVVESKNSAYLDAKLFITDDGVIPVGAVEKGIKKYGTRYLINKNYTIEREKRIFEKKSVVYTSNYEIDEEAVGYVNCEVEGRKIPNILIDRVTDDEYYIVNLV